MSPIDAEKLGILSGNDVVVSTRRGSVDIEAAVTPRIPEGMLWMVFHYAETPTNVLTSSFVDPVSKTPEYKFCAAKVAVK
jgi:formate dehydrogenase alpha subunit